MRFGGCTRVSRRARNVEYFAKLRGMPETTRGERNQAPLADLRLTAIAGRPVAGFSQGERIGAALRFSG